jgi:hypothetical protein
MPTQRKKDFTSPNTKNYCYTVKKQLEENTMLCYFDDISEPRNHQVELNTDAPSTQRVQFASLSKPPTLNKCAAAELTLRGGASAPES